jgi:nitrite reductase/ring-hydroxylating ferredoxin subunit
MRNRTVPQYVRVAKLSEIPPGTGVSRFVRGYMIAIFRSQDDKVYATQDECPHERGPLGEGPIEGETVTCPWHGWQFNAATGECLTFPGMEIERYPVKVEGEDILVEIG